MNINLDDCTKLQYFKMLNQLIVLVDNLPIEGKMLRFQANQIISMLEKFRKEL